MDIKKLNLIGGSFLIPLLGYTSLRNYNQEITKVRNYKNIIQTYIIQFMQSFHNIKVEILHGLE
jgi:glucose-6-phosphate isomerase